MDTQDARAQVADDRPVVIHHDDVPTLVPAVAPRRHPRHRAGRGPGLRRAVLARVAVGVLLAAVLGGWWATRGDDPVRTTPAPAAAGPVVPDPLGLDVTAPTDAVAGQPATLVVRYTDGAGIFSGSTEDWGDDVGTSSLTEGRCAAGAAGRTCRRHATRATHTWSEPGSYTVKVAVSTYTCDDGDARRGAGEHDGHGRRRRALSRWTGRQNWNGLGGAPSDARGQLREVEAAERRAPRRTATRRSSRWSVPNRVTVTR